MQAKKLQDYEDTICIAHGLAGFLEDSGALEPTRLPDLLVQALDLGIAAFHTEA